MRTIAVAIITWAVMSIPASGREAVVVNDTFVTHYVDTGIEYIEDRSGSRTVDEVRKDPSWKKTASGVMNFGITDSAYWFRFTVRNAAGAPFRGYVECTYPQIDRFDLYHFGEDGEHTVKRNGDGIPAREREIRFRTPVNAFTAPPGDSDCYLRVSSINPLSFRLRVMSEQGLRDLIAADSPIRWCLYLVMLVMILYNLIIYLFVREASYLYFVCFLFFMSLIDMGLSGVGFLHFWPEAIVWQSVGFVVTIPLAVCSITLFITSFMGTKKNYPLLHRLAVYTVLIPGAVMAGPYAAASLVAGRQIVEGLQNFLVMYFCLLNVFIGVPSIIRRPIRQAWFIIGAFAFLMVASLFSSLGGQGVIPQSMATDLGMPAGMVSAAVLLSAGLADKINRMKNELNGANASLERRVLEVSALLGNIRESAIELTGFSRKMNEMAEDLHRRMADQSSNLVQTTASLEELSSSIENIAQNAGGQVELIRNGTRHMLEYIDSTSRIRNAAGRAAELSEYSMRLANESRQGLDGLKNGMLNIRSSTGAIHDITEILNEISEKTNLLSLNASIEAARAGQYGRGFAVVAGEIGKLAERAMRESKSIQVIVESIVSDINNESEMVIRSLGSMDGINSSVESVNTAVKAILGMCNAQEELTRSMEENMRLVNDGSCEISNATMEDTMAIQQVNGAIEMLNAITGATVSSAQDLTSMMEKLRHRIVLLERSAGGVN